MNSTESPRGGRYDNNEYVYVLRDTRRLVQRDTRMRGFCSFSGIFFSLFFFL